MEWLFVDSRENLLCYLSTRLVCHFASLAITVCLAMVIFSGMQTGIDSLIIGRLYKATKSGDLYSEPPSVIYRITKNFRDKKLSRNVTQKKKFRERRAIEQSGAWLGHLRARAKASSRAPRRLRRRRGSSRLRANMPTDARVSLHSRERKMASMKIAGLPG